MPRRRATTPLTRERVLAAALAAADADGIKGVTMRRLAEDLDCEAMSLYHYVPNKAGLIDALIESVLMEIGGEQHAAGEPAGDWRAIIRHRCLAARQVMLRHPWAPTLFATHPDTPPVMFGFYEQFVATLVEGGFDYDLAHRAIHSLGSLVFGFTQVFEDNPHTRVQEGELAQAVLQRLAIIDGHRERLRAGQEAHSGAGIGRTIRFGRAAADRLQRRFCTTAIDEANFML